MVSAGPEAWTGCGVSVPAPHAAAQAAMAASWMSFILPGCRERSIPFPASGEFERLSLGRVAADIQLYTEFAATCALPTNPGATAGRRTARPPSECPLRR